RGGIHRARAQRREGTLQLPQDRVGDQAKDGATGTGAGQADCGYAALGGGSAEAVASCAGGRCGQAKPPAPAKTTTNQATSCRYSFGLGGRRFRLPNCAAGST